MKIAIPFLFFISVFFSLGCDKLLPGKDTALFLNDTILGYSHDGRLSEISGMVASKENPGYFWVHNDRGDKANIYLIDSAVNVVKTVTITYAIYNKLEGDKKVSVLDTVFSLDWEDITRQQYNDKNYLIIGDIGDNFNERDSVILFRFEEPLFEGITDTPSHVTAEKMIIKYSDGTKDAEALLCDPSTNDIIIITKRELTVGYYIFPFNNTKTTISLTGNILTTSITGGDINTNGDILIKNYWDVFLFKNPNGASTKILLQKGEFDVVNYVQELQGEAICWGLDNASYFTISEKKDGKAQPFYLYY